MRKCGACGYLLFGDGDTCTHCGAVLAAVPAGAAAFGSPPAAPPVPPPAPRFPAAPPPPVAPAPAPRQFGGPPPSAAPTPPAGAPVWHAAPPLTVTPAPASSTRVGRIAVAVVILLVIAGIGGAILQRSKSVPPGTSAFIDGHGIDYTSADRTYSAQLPQQPKVAQQAVNVGGYTGTMSLSLVQTNDYELGTASLPLPIEVPAARLNAALDDAMTQGLGTVSDGRGLHTRHFMRGGYPAAEVSFKAKDGYGAHALVMVGGNTIFLMFSHAKAGADTLFHALDKSFRVNIGR
jgi:hypothetical protein